MILQQNQILQTRVEALEHVCSEEINIKQKYMEGALWMGKRMASEIEQMCQSFEYLLGEYDRRLLDGGNGEDRGA